MVMYNRMVDQLKISDFRKSKKSSDIGSGGPQEIVNGGRGPNECPSLGRHG